MLGGFYSLWFYDIICWVFCRGVDFGIENNLGYGVFVRG